MKREHGKFTIETVEKKGRHGFIVRYQYNSEDSCILFRAEEVFVNPSDALFAAKVWLDVLLTSLHEALV